MSRVGGASGHVLSVSSWGLLPALAREEHMVKWSPPERMRGEKSNPPPLPSHGGHSVSRGEWVSLRRVRSHLNPLNMLYEILRRETGLTARDPA